MKKFALIMSCFTLLAGLFSPSTKAAGYQDGVNIDIARNYQSLEHLKKIVERIDESNGNYLHLHFSDDQGYRIASDILGQTSTEKNNQYLTKSEVKSLINYANERDIMVVPELDVPAHSTAWLNLLKQSNPEAYKETVSDFDSGMVNFFDDEKALSHVKALQNEVQEMFKQPKFEGQQRIVLGGDEVPGSGSNQKAFVNFMNQLGSNATQKGYKPQMWNDSLRAEGLKSLDKSFSILHWKQGSYGKADPGPTAKEFTDAGFALYNYNMMTSYFLPGPEYRNKDMGAIAKEFFEKFDYHTFYENGRSNNQVEDANVKGGAMSFWCEKTGNMHEDDIYKQQHPIITSYLNAAKNED